MKRSGILIARFALFGAALGIGAGLCEAAILSSAGWLHFLHTSFVGWATWLLAPLADLLLWGLWGLILGVAVVLTRQEKPWVIAALMLGQVSLAAFQTAEVVEVLRINRTSPHHHLEALVWAGLIFAGLLLALRALWRHVGKYFAEGVFAPPKRLARAVLAAAVVLGMGLSYSLTARPGSGAAIQAATAPSSSHPNIVLITLDTVRADHLSAYGYQRPTTPNLDRLASQGVLFENAIASTSWTLGSHASIFTGLLPHQHGADWYVPLNSNSSTLARILMARGYEAAGFSANHGYGTLRWGLGQGFGQYEDYMSSFRHNFGLTLVGRQVGGLATRLNPYYCIFERDAGDDLNRDIREWFEHRSDRPYFLFVNYFDAHAPYVPKSASAQSRFGPFADSLLAMNVEYADHRSFARQISQIDRARVIDGYDNSLAFLDEQIGELFPAAPDSLAKSNSFVIITSDHGEAFGEHGTYNHGWDLYREVIHVPLIIFGPGIPAGKRVPSVVDLRDLFATVLDLAQAQTERTPGATLRRFWSTDRGPSSSDAAVVSEVSRYQSTGPDAKDTISLVTDEWQYIHDSNGREELYRWPSDPEESRNLAGLSPEYQGTAAELRARLCEAMVSSLNPLRGREYLAALNETNSSSPGRLVMGCGLESKLPPERLRTPSEEEELLRSLPYH